MLFSYLKRRWEPAILIIWLMSWVIGGAIYPETMVRIINPETNYTHSHSFVLGALAGLLVAVISGSLILLTTGGTIGAVTLVISDYKKVKAEIEIETYVKNQRLSREQAQNGALSEAKAGGSLSLAEVNIEI